MEPGLVRNLKPESPAYSVYGAMGLQTLVDYIKAEGFDTSELLLCVKNCAQLFIQGGYLTSEGKVAISIEPQLKVGLIRNVRADEITDLLAKSFISANPLSRVYMFAPNSCVQVAYDVLPRGGVNFTVHVQEKERLVDGFSGIATRLGTHIQNYLFEVGSGDIFNFVAANAICRQLLIDMADLGQLNQNEKGLSQLIYDLN